MQLLKCSLMLLFYMLFYLGVHVLVHKTMSWHVVGAAAINGVLFLVVSVLLDRLLPNKRRRT